MSRKNTQILTGRKKSLYNLFGKMQKLALILTSWHYISIWVKTSEMVAAKVIYEFIIKYIFNGPAANLVQPLSMAVWNSPHYDGFYKFTGIPCLVLFLGLWIVRKQMTKAKKEIQIVPAKTSSGYSSESISTSYTDPMPDNTARMMWDTKNFVSRSDNPYQPLGTEQLVRFTSCAGSSRAFDIYRDLYFDRKLEIAGMLSEYFKEEYIEALKPFNVTLNKNKEVSVNIRNREIRLLKPGDRYFLRGQDGSKLVQIERLK